MLQAHNMIPASATVRKHGKDGLAFTLSALLTMGSRAEAAAQCSVKTLLKAARRSPERGVKVSFTSTSSSDDVASAADDDVANATDDCP